MRRYKLLVMTEPTQGREREFNDWYQNVHLRDVVAVPGIKSAQRFRLDHQIIPGAKPLPYLAIYEIETDDVQGVMKEMMARAGSARMVISEALSMETTVGVVYEELGPAVQAGR